VGGRAIVYFCSRVRSAVEGPRGGLGNDFRPREIIVFVLAIFRANIFELPVPARNLGAANEPLWKLSAIYGSFQQLTLGGGGVFM